MTELNPRINRRQLLKKAGVVAASSIGLVGAASGPALAGGPGKTIWFVRMSNERPLAEKDFSPALIDAMVAEGLIANSPAELMQNHDLAREILGQKLILSEIRPFAALAKQQGVDVKLLFVPWDRALWEIKQLYQEKVVRHNEVLILQVPSSWCAQFASENMLMDLSDLVDPANYQRTTLKWYTWQQKVYAVPYVVDLRFVFFNKDLLSESDFTSPEAFADACKRCKQKLDANRFVLGIPAADGFDSFHFLATLFWDKGLQELISNGNRLVVFPWTEAHLADAKAQETVRLLADMRWKGYLDAPAVSSERIANDFLGGKYAMVLHGSWVLNEYEKLPDDQKRKLRIGIALPPDLGGGRYTFEGGSGLGICAGSNADSQSKNLAISILKSWTSAESQLKHSESTGELPAHLKSQEGFGRYQRIRSETGWKPDKSRIYPILPQWGPFVEQLPVVNHLYGFWRKLQAITPATGQVTAQQSRDFADASDSLVARLEAMNQTINGQLSPGAWDQLNMPRIITATLVAGPLTGALAAVWHLRQRAEAEKTLATERAAKLQAEAKLATERAAKLEAEQQAAILEARQEALQTTSGMASHRLRNVLPVVSGMIHRTIEKGKVIDEGVEWCTIALEETRRAQEVVRGFIDFAQTMTYSLPDELSGGELVEYLAGVAKRSAHHRDTQIELKVDEKLPTVKVNLGRLTDDIINFVNDSERHRSSQLHIMLTATLHESDVDEALGLQAGSKYLKLIYADNGPGISDDKKQWIFVPFRTTEANGSGLGLAIAARDAKVHKGALIECGQAGSGVRFEFYLPTEKGDE